MEAKDTTTTSAQRHFPRQEEMKTPDGGNSEVASPLVSPCLAPLELAQCRGDLPPPC